jgi:PAS domain S-box-containing protein
MVKTVQENASSPEFRALIVENDPEIRRNISDTLMNRGFLVSSCDSISKAREFYRSHSLVVTGCISENGEVQRFVDFVRETSTESQPYIITLKEAAVAATALPGPGVNDLLGLPLDERSLKLKVDVASAWLASRLQPPIEIVTEDIEFMEEEVTTEFIDEDFEINYGDDQPDENFGNFVLDPAEPQDEPDISPEVVESIEEIIEEQPEEEIIITPAPKKSASQSAITPANTLRYHMAQLIETVPYGLALFDTGMHYRVVNERWKQCFGLETDTVIGRSHYEIFDDVPAQWKHCCQRAVETEEEQTDLELVQWADGSRERVRWTMRPWHYESGESGGVAVSFEHIDDPAPAKPKALIETDLAAALAQSSTAPVLVLDAHGRIVRSNQLAREMGVWNEVSDKDRFYWQVYLSKEHRPAAQEAFINFATNVIDQGLFSFPSATLDTVPCVDGTTRQIAWHNLPRHSPDGKVNGMIRIGVNVAELSQDSTPNAVLSDERWLSQLPTLHWKARRDGKLIFFNDAWLEFRGRTIEEETDNGWMDGLHEDDHARLVESFLELDESDGRMNQMARLQNAHGEFRWMRFAIHPTKYSNAKDGDVFVGFCEDITEIKRYEQQLTKLEESNTQFEEQLEDAQAALAEKEPVVAQFASLQTDYDSMLGESAKIADSLRIHEENAEQLRSKVTKLQSDLDVAHESNDKLKLERGRFAAIPENAPFGIIVLSRDGRTLYANPAHTNVVGSDITAVETFEEWLRSRCPEDTEEARTNLINTWREHVWRGHHTHVFSLTSDDDSLRELEVRPKMMRDGQFLLSIFDITDSRRGETALRTSEAKFRALFYDSGVAMALTDKKGSIIDANSSAVKLFGRAKTDIAKHRIEEFIAEADRPVREELLEHLQLSQQRTGDTALSVISADGTKTLVQMNVSMVRENDGLPLFTAYFFHPHAEVEPEIVEVEVPVPVESGPELLSSPDLIMLTSASGQIEKLIPSAKFAKSIDPAKAVGMKVSDLFPGIKTSITELGARATQSGDTIVHPFVLTEKDGDHDYECCVAKNGADGLAIIVRQAPPKPAPVKDAEAPAPVAVDSNIQRKALAFANIPDAFVVADLKGRIIDWNPGAENLFGYASEEILNKPLYHLYDQEDPKRFKASITAGIAKHRRWKQRTTFIHKNGTVGTCEADFVPLLDENGTPVALIGSNREVTAEQLKAEAAPAPPPAPEKKSAIPSRKPTREKNDGIPSGIAEKNLASISQMLELQESSTKERHALKAISAGSGRARALTMLQKQATEAGDYDEIDFGQFVRSLVQELLERVGPEDTAIEVHLSAKNVFVPYSVAAPLASCLNEFLTNSLTHAFSGREEGVVTVGANVGTDGKGRLFVRDDGTGLPEWLDIHESPGLGFQITNKLAKQLNGEVHIAPGKDTEFQVTFQANA